MLLPTSSSLDCILHFHKVTYNEALPEAKGFVVGLRSQHDAVVLFFGRQGQLLDVQLVQDVIAQRLDVIQNLLVLFSSSEKTLHIWF